jgi:pilus assembly protein Flp/PilA
MNVDDATRDTSRPWPNAVGATFVIGHWSRDPAPTRLESLSVQKVTIVDASKVRSLGARLLADESGAEVMEYVLIAGLIIVGTIATIAALGTKVLARWTSVETSSL